MTTEQEFLSHVARRLGRSPEPAPAPFRPSRPVGPVGPKGGYALADRFQQELEKISGVVHRVKSEGEVAPLIARILKEAGAAGKPVARWADPALDALGIDQALTAADHPVVAFQTGGDGRAFVEAVEKAAAGVVACDAAIAETGTIVMTTALTRGRTVSLLPPLLIAVLRKEQIRYSSVDVFRALASGAMPSQVIFKSGPSRSSDIENDLSIGVHGPGALHVILI